jgi:aspartate kinase
VHKQLKPVLKDQSAVIQGFMGSDTMNRTTTLGRGGSDYSATLLGSFLEADRVEIWSDVDGILTADPTIVPDAHRIRYMSLHEASELAYFGAKVMHPASLLPALRKGIPVDVLNSTNPSYAGTRIGTKKQTPQLHGCPVKSIAYKEGITVIKVTSTRMLMAHGFMASIFEIFDRFKTPVDLISTSEVSVSITVDQSDHLDDILRELSRVARVDVLDHKAIVCLVGDDLNKHRGIPGQVFSILQDITIDQISQGASEINISFVIDESDIETVIRRLHNSFFQGHMDPTIFDHTTIQSMEEE